MKSYQFFYQSEMSFRKRMYCFEKDLKEKKGASEDMQTS